MFFSEFRKKRKIIEAIQHKYTAYTYFEKGNFDAAIQEIMIALDKYPIKENKTNNILTSDDREFYKSVHNHLGASYGRKAYTLKETEPERIKLFEHALKEYEKILEHDLNNKEAAEAYNNIGACQEALGDLESSIKSRNKSLDYDPEYSESYINLGNNLVEQKKYYEAIQHFSFAINLKGDYAEAYYSRALLYTKIGKIQDAIFDYNSAIKYKKDFYFAYLNCGILFSEIGIQRNAIDYFINALVFCDNNTESIVDTHCRLGMSLAKIEKKNEALSHFNKAITSCSSPEYIKYIENIKNIYL